ncbi:hypothetical protein [Alkalicoccus halolimnae]|uniref:YtxH domain-containing protein n=1 Tax=Alkalicoccus halolimnae TaxID=1667239 RepID=A0A5C7F5I7_9BACI|nr:hypothetical protein [Alkalicoccus halolimnae]TXF85902.1 hypothetical protein FTX54_07445 [Alkalicoccus halolimnae]
MAKWYVSTLAASAIAAAGYYLGNEKNREKVGHYINRAKAEIKGDTKEDNKEDFYEKVGHSDPQDLEDNSMVDEGAMFSVNYYNQNIKGEEQENDKDKQ